MGATTNKIKGKALRIVGALTGDKRRSAQGAIVETRGDVEGKAARAGRKVKRAVKRVLPKSRG